jgi:hypothetical protein
MGHWSENVKEGPQQDCKADHEDLAESEDSGECGAALKLLLMSLRASLNKGERLLGAEASSDWQDLGPSHGTHGAEVYGRGRCQSVDILAPGVGGRVEGREQAPTRKDLAGSMDLGAQESSAEHPGASVHSEGAESTQTSHDERRQVRPAAVAFPMFSLPTDLDTYPYQYSIDGKPSMGPLPGVGETESDVQNGRDGIGASCIPHGIPRANGRICSVPVECVL